MADTKDTPGISLDTATREVARLVEDAHDFISSELEESWELAERYYRGETDLLEYEGRSNVVKTEVRDAIRNTVPSVMRVLMQSRKIVEYIPSSIQHAPWVDQQSQYARQLFFQNNGYMATQNAVIEALKLKICPMKAYWEPDPLPEYVKHTKVPFSFIEELMNDPLFEIEELEESETNITQLGNGQAISLYDVSGYKFYENGRIKIEYIPNYEFFISRNVSNLEEALEYGVHGQRGIVSVSEALDMGLEYDDWLELDYEDPEESDNTGSATAKRGYNKEHPAPSKDVLRHQFLLTEAYVKYDLKQTGRPQLYRFYLGGTSYKYIDHEEVEDSPFAIMMPMPQPGTVYGMSMTDITIKEQDTSSSLLRAAIDNAHAANNVRIAADPTKTNFDDIFNTALNAPIRKRAGDTLQAFQVPFTGQGNLALLGYLDQDVQNKVGITKAAQGLDPDALQSTDKNAVMNTIMTSQGQTELIVRNIVESCLIRLFKIILKLSIRHMDSIQLLKVKDKFVPVNIMMFDPDAAAEPVVGLGTASPMQKQAALSFVLQKQEEYMRQFGPNNPFTSFSQIYNTMEDLLEANGLYNVPRYFNYITPEIEKQWARAQEQQQKAMLEMQQKNQPMDPSKAFIEVEAGKRRIDELKVITDHQQKSEELRLKALETAEKLDIERDKLIQTRVIELSKIAANEYGQEIVREQESNERISTGTGASSKKSA